MRALDGLRVLELGGHVAAPYATKLLADLGADVVKVEPPGGDPLRAWGPFPAGVPDLEAGGLFRYLNAGKRSVVLDVADPAGADGARRLAAGADVVVEHLGAGALERLGIDVEGPALVRISEFGQTGPYRDRPATDLTVQAAAGWVSTHGVPGRPVPMVKVGGRLPEYVAGVHAAAAALTAWRAVRLGGGPVTVDVSIHECLVATLAYPMLFFETLQRLGLPPPRNRYFPVPGVVACKDGWVGLNALTAQQWADTCALLGVPEYEDRMQELTESPEARAELFERIRPWLEEHTTEEIVELAQAFRIPSAPVTDGRTLCELPQLRARDFFVRDHEGGFERPGVPYRLSRTPATEGGRAPRLGEHQGALEGSGPWAERRDRLPGTSRLTGTGRLPFAGLRVIDLGTFWAGPSVSCYLGALGADVVKVESIQRPDGFRYNAAFPQEGPDWYERSGLWQATNLNKRDVTLDLTREDGRELLLALVAGADVVLESFSPRVMDNFGLSEEQLRRARPDLVLVRMPAFGLEGPWRDYVGWAMVIEQASGMAAVTGTADEPPRHPGGFVDPVVGMHTLVALQAALEHRAATGEGQRIEVAQLETGACLTAEQVITWSMLGRVEERTGNRSRSGAPEGVYPCGDGEWVAVSVRHDADWEALVDAMGAPPWAREAALGDEAQRRARLEDLDARIAGWTVSLTADEVVARLLGRGVPAARVLEAPRMYGEPHLEAREFYQELHHDRSGTRRYPVFPTRFSFGGRHRFGAPTLGQHNREVLIGELGLTEARFDELAATGVIGDRLPAPASEAETMGRRA